MDRRALVFTIFAVVCLALYPLADKYDGSASWSIGGEGWAWVPVILGVVYLVLALLSFLDARSKDKLEPRPLGYDRGAGVPSGRPTGSAGPGGGFSGSGEPVTVEADPTATDSAVSGESADED